VSGLHNSGRLPMVLSMTCYSAPFDNPTEDSIGERFLREPDRGAIAVFAASWRNSPSAAFSKAIVAELIKPGRSIGESIVVGKHSTEDATLVETYNLLGDPAVVLERPLGEFRLVRKPQPFGPDRVEAQIGRSGFRGSAEATWLDGHGKVLHSTRFAVLGQRFTLPDPPADVRSRAAEVRGYVADPNNPFDAIARIDLSKPALAPAKPVVPAGAVALRRPLNAPTNTPDVINVGDVILSTGFDQGSPEVEKDGMARSAKAAAQ